MKRYMLAPLLAAVVTVFLQMCIYAEDNTETISYNYSYDMENGYTAENAKTREMEKLDRGLVAVKTADGVYLSWRLLDSEDAVYGSAEDNVSFNIYRDGEAEPIANISYSTNYIDKTAGASYSVAPVVNGAEGERCSPVSVMENSYIDIELDRPDAAVLPDGSIAEYVSGDVSCGDLDGDGEYELVAVWLTSSSSGGMYTPAFNGPILLDAYELDGTRLWEEPIDLGVNVFTDQHNMQFLVYDFDGDGTAEITCQTSAGTRDALGNYVNTVSADENVRAIDNSIDYRDAYGRTYTAPELFTVFGGKDGGAIDTIYYPINICSPSVWGDSVANRSTRFLADVSYLDGEKPYAVYWRGYYYSYSSAGRTGVFGACFDGERLNVKYIFDSFDVENSMYADSYVGIPAYTPGNEIYIGQGNHNITTADVDGDGKDEIISGALCFEVDGDDKLMPKWCSFRGHGDALHIGDYDPTHAGLEYFSVHESGDAIVTMPDGSEKTLDYGMTLYDAATGEELFHAGADKDTGSGIMLNSGQGGYFQMIVSTGVGTYIGNGGGVYEKADTDAEKKFRIFWDGDLYDEIAAENNIFSWNGIGYENIFTADGCVGANPGGRGPVLQADLFGDWREEVIYPAEDYSRLRVFMTTVPTDYKIKTLMHDPVYRSGIAAEQTATNASPHVGFYIGSELFDEEIPEIRMLSAPDKTKYVVGVGLRTDGFSLEASYENGSTRIISPEECSFSGYDPYKTGVQTVYAEYMGQTVSFEVDVLEIEDIFVSRLPDTTVNYKGAPLNTYGLVIAARYGDGSVEELKPDEYSISYSSDTLGTQEVTVTYMDKTVSFEVMVVEPNAKALSRNYYNSSTESTSVTIPVGSLAGDFTLEHTVTIHSMPADCTSNKNDTNGFFLRFINSEKNYIGGGWYLSASGDKALVAWKHAAASADNICTIDIGKTYTFKYEFRDISTGAENGAYVNIEIIDENGNTVGTAENLNLRNFSQTNSGKETPITDVQIYNQAKPGSAGNITFADAQAYGMGEIFLDGSSITAELTGSTQNERVIAAKYDNGVLTDIRFFDSLNLGENIFSAPFVPDNVFLWSSDMRRLSGPEGTSTAE